MLHPDHRDHSQAQVDAAVRRALQEVGLSPTYLVTVRALVRGGDESWRRCCGGHCEPCIYTVEAAVDAARALLRDGFGAELRDPPPPPPRRRPRPSPAPEDDERDPADRNWGLDYA